MTTRSIRLRIAVLFGGRSTEHNASVLSATNIMQAIEPTKYDAVPVFVTREGRWLLSKFENDTLATPSAGTEVCLLPGGRGRMIAVMPDGSISGAGTIDILFPVLHGLHGEDGSVQGLADVARVPLAGCGILGSATSLDKEIAKQLLRSAGLPAARSVTIHMGKTPSLAALQRKLGSPIFIKPARQGSSVGVRKISGTEEFALALAQGFKHDCKLLAEEFIPGFEIECCVLEDTKGGLFVSRPGQIKASESHGFYSYDAKYVDRDGAALTVPAELPEDVEMQIQEAAALAFRALGCDGMARVDLFLTANMQFYINEVNTIPGFTSTSMYPKLLAASGVSYREFINRLVEHGLARAARAT
ncbi:D-alanine--D-alanine ligase [Rhizobium laguerreae]|uniref:D-alanine--D-alanine ligase family protein n=1 Tax=Rhizobium laguerreae TaxID=1076926 RepID=UPI001C907892|nr:D-alanine--D-alanine ligase family protein [Rhizobium laguerreae]MBY3307372.1 D-alanine--D-alanine ligase [Rhizobium laguerreae]